MSLFSLSRISSLLGRSLSISVYQPQKGLHTVRCKICALSVLFTLNPQKSEQEVTFGFLYLSIYYHVKPLQQVQLYLFSYRKKYLKSSL